jgi:hypothetical protein
MAQTNYTPISLYYSTTAAAVPVNTNLVNGELAINITDGKLFYKDNGGTVQVLATKGAGTIGGSNTQVQYNNSGALAGSANLTFNGTTLTANTLNLTNALGTTYGGTGLSSFTSGGVVYASSSSALTTGSALTFNGSDFGVSASVATATLASSGAYSALIFTNSGGATKAGLILTNSNGILQSRAETSAWTNYDASSEYMRLTSTGLGIGTSSPGAKLEVAGTAGNTLIRINRTDSTAARGALQWTGSDGVVDWQIGTNMVASGGLEFSTGQTSNVLMTLDSSGNLGLGVTPSAWGGSKALQIGGGSVWNSSGAGNIFVGANYYFDGVNRRYIANGFATEYLGNGSDGTHTWYNAPSGTAGNAITFTQAMTLTASGRLGIGNTSPTAGLSITRNGQDNANNTTTGSALTIDWGSPGASSSFAIRGTNTSAGISGNTFVAQIIGGAGSQNALEIYTAGATPLVFGTNATERARIDSSGNLLVGQTSQTSTEKFGVTNTGDNYVAYFKGGSAGQYSFGILNPATSGDNLFQVFLTDGGAGTVRGSITYNRAGGLTVYNTTSDYRAKDISGPVIDSGALIDSVPVYTGKMKWATQERPMFLAHETPEYAHTGEKDAVDADGNPVYQQMDASALIPVMWAEIQSLRIRIAQLENKL